MTPGYVCTRAICLWVGKLNSFHFCFLIYKMRHNKIYPSMELQHSIEMVFIKMLYVFLINNVSVKGFVFINHGLIIIIELFCFMFRRHDNTFYVWQFTSFTMLHVTYILFFSFPRKHRKTILKYNFDHLDITLIFNPSINGSQLLPQNPAHTRKTFFIGFLVKTFQIDT